MMILKTTMLITEFQISFGIWEKKLWIGNVKIKHISSREMSVYQ